MRRLLPDLQSAIGNQAVQRLQQAKNEKPPINQPKAQHGDRHEQEADHAANQVMQRGEPNQSAQGDAVARDPQSLHSPAYAYSGSGNALDFETRRFFEGRFGYNFAKVRVHSDDRAWESTRRLGARAYTRGEHISFAAGEYKPLTREGKQLLAHELAHVVQQTRVPTHSPTRALSASLSKAPLSGVQRKLVAKGDTAGFASVTNAIIAVQQEIRVSATGEVSIHPTAVQGPPTRDAQELLNTLRTVINDRKTTTIDFIHGATSTRAGDKQVIVGNYALARVDLDDISTFGLKSSHSREGDNAAVQLIHEITEQYRKQIHGEAFGVAHQAGYAAQERLLGATLTNESPMTPIGGDLGEVTTTYRYPDGREVDVITRMNFTTGQIVSVRRVIR